ncbi:DUF805 domain-containing protein [Lactococcus nasutitermitis]|uniref:DUF805 domain-containing protein n=1 Tax=Lactococcus nasutitermitis TaxID=1652957 RepID=A0ABV9JH90_9LACT|nr:DUF805 domain-containing protein [Lactococcus nasutitermitis]
MLQAYQKFFLGYTNFKNRTSRKDFWLALLAHLIVCLILIVAAQIFHALDNQVLANIWTGLSWFVYELLMLYSFATLLPILAMTVRRLRDLSLPWGLIFLTLFPFLGSIILLAICALESSQSSRNIPEFSKEQLEVATVNETGKIDFFQAIKNYFRGYIDFRGRTKRASFWWTQLVFVGIAALLGILVIISFVLDDLIFGERVILSIASETLLSLYLIGIIFPELAIHFRRLRDVGLNHFASILLLSSLGGAISFIIILHQLTYFDYGIYKFELANYLFFMIVLVLVLVLIIVEISPTDDLLRENKSIFFRKS